MSISEFVQECEADTDAAVRFAGSIDCGAVDTEHTPVACWPDVVNRRIAALEQEVAELRASAPWVDLEFVLRSADRYSRNRRAPLGGALRASIAAVRQWLDDYAPREGGK